MAKSQGSVNFWDPYGHVKKNLYMWKGVLLDTLRLGKNCAKFPDSQFYYQGG